MSAPLNLTGKRINKENGFKYDTDIKVIAPVHDRYGKPQVATNGKRLWQLKCLRNGPNCKREFIAPLSDVVNGNTKTCGCSHGREALDLEEQKFHQLTVVKRLERRKRNGDILWLCKCKCGGKKVTSTTLLRTGKVKSCGCLHILKNKAKAKQHHKDKEVLSKEGVPYYAARRVARLLKIHITTLYCGSKRIGWKKSCPFNNGEGLPTSLLPSGLNREIEYFHGPTIDRVKDNIARTRPVPTIPNEVYFADALRLLGWSKRTLDRRMKAEGVKVAKHEGVAIDGQPCKRTFIPEWFVDKHKTPSSRGGVVFDMPQVAGINRAGELPIEPTPTRSMSMTKEYLEQQAEAVFRGLEKHAEKKNSKPKRGAIPPDSFVWDGQEVNDLSAPQWRFLDALCDGKNLRNGIPEADLTTAIYGSNPPQGVSKAIVELQRRTQKKLDGANIRLMIECSNGSYRLIPFGSK